MSREQRKDGGIKKTGEDPHPRRGFYRESLALIIIVREERREPGRGCEDRLGLRVLARGDLATMCP